MLPAAALVRRLFASETQVNAMRHGTDTASTVQACHYRRPTVHLRRCTQAGLKAGRARVAPSCRDELRARPSVACSTPAFTERACARSVLRSLCKSQARGIHYEQGQPAVVPRFSSRSVRKDRLRRRHAFCINRCCCERQPPQRGAGSPPPSPLLPREGRVTIRKKTLKMKRYWKPCPFAPQLTTHLH